MTEIFDELGVNKNVEYIQRLGKFDNERKKPRAVLVKMTNEWDARIVLAKSAEKKKLLSESAINILPGLSREDFKKIYV